MKPKMVKETTECQKENELIVEPGAKIALAIIRNGNGSVSVICAEDVFMDCDDDSVEQILNCVKDTINTCRNKNTENAVYLN